MDNLLRGFIELLYGIVSVLTIAIALYTHNHYSRKDC